MLPCLFTAFELSAVAVHSLVRSYLTDAFGKRTVLGDLSPTLGFRFLTWKLGLMMKIHPGMASEN